MAIYSAVACLLFLFLYVVSSYINTVNLLSSVEHLAMFALYVFVFFLSMRFAVEKKRVLWFLIGISLGATALYVLHLLNLFPLPFLTHQDFQFILPTEGGHNHLGDLAGLGLISSLLMGSAPLFFVFQLIFLVVISVSFSKSAIVATIFTVFFLMIHKRKYLAFFVGLTLTAGILIGIYSKVTIPFTPLDNLQKTAQKALHIKPKPLLSSREKYIKQILKPWTATPLEHLFFGYGPGNFRYASNRAAESSWDVVTETHNILLTFFVESGFLPMVWFVIFFIITAYIGYKNQNPFTYLLLYLFMHFQMDYTYRIPFFLYLFFFLCGQTIPISTKRPFLFSSKNIAILVSFCIMVIFVVLNHGAIRKYRNLNTKLNRGIQTKDRAVFVSAAKDLERMTPYESDLLLTLASFHESFGNIDESIRLLDKLYVYAPREYFANLPHLMALQKKMKKNTRVYLEQKEKDFRTFPFNEKEKSYLDHTCREYLERECL